MMRYQNQLIRCNHTKHHNLKANTFLTNMNLWIVFFGTILTVFATAAFLPNYFHILLISLAISSGTFIFVYRFLVPILIKLMGTSMKAYAALALAGTSTIRLISNFRCLVALTTFSFLGEYT